MSIGDTYRPLREVVADELRGMILRGELVAGERLLEDRLAEQLGVSRNPVREAIRSLEATGLVEVVPRRGAYVCRPDLADVRHLLELRCVLEGYAAEAAAARRDPQLVAELTRCIDEGLAAARSGNYVRAAELHRDFHLALERAAGNPYLMQVVEPLRHRTEMVFSILLDQRADMGWAEHEHIRDAVAQGDAEAARRTVRDHIMAVLDDLERTPAGNGDAAG